MRSKFEIRGQKELEKEDYKVDYKYRPRIVGRNYNVDYFGLFDLLAYKAHEPLRMISIKPASNTPVKHKEAIRNFIITLGVQKELWRFDRDPKNKSKIRIRKEIIF